LVRNFYSVNDLEVLRDCHHIGLLHKNAKILFLGLDNAGKTVRFIHKILRKQLLNLVYVDSTAHAQK
jgi:GTPase SAR1 family protein